MPHDDHPGNQVAQIRIDRRRLLQSGGLVASGALAGAASFPTASLAGAATRERRLSSPEPVPHAITLAQDDATPRALSTEEMSTPTALDDLNGDNFDHTGLGFIRGAVIFAGASELPIGKSRALAPGVPAWGAAYKRWVHENADSFGSIFAQVAPLPYEDVFLDLDPTMKDPLGVPVICITSELKENETAASLYIDEKLDDLMRVFGASETWQAYPAGTALPINTHAYGGTRMGDDPATSVVTKYGLAHEAPNLMILRGSTFPGSSGYNPTETLQALAWFGADHLASNFSDIAL